MKFLTAAYQKAYIAASEHYFGQGSESALSERMSNNKKCVAALGFLALAIIDAGNVKVDTCVYAVDGSGSGVADMAQSFELDLSVFGSIEEITGCKLTVTR